MTLVFLRAVVHDTDEPETVHVKDADSPNKENKKQKKEVKKMKGKNTKQMNLFGEFVATETKDLEFIKVYEEVVSDGDQFRMKMNSAVYNEEKGCLTVVDGEKAQALTVYFTLHPDARYNGTPDGIRLGRAMQRCVQATAPDVETLRDLITEGDFELTITHTGSKGRLWTVRRN